MVEWLARVFGKEKADPRYGYRGDGFSVSIGRGEREIVYVTYARGWSRLKLEGELTGDKWDSVWLGIPMEISRERALGIAQDLEVAFRAMGRGYTIFRL